VAEGWEEVNRRFERLMGPFQGINFARVVMLPQGQFQKLLTSRSDERQAILEALFQVHAYARIEQAMKEAAGDVKDRIEAARRSRRRCSSAAGMPILSR